jgi:phospho-N-acetylmuramoyl-pentapeptide-transferase
MNTPSSFGILFVFNLLLLLLFSQWIGSPYQMILISSIILGIFGFADDVYQFFLYERVGVWGIRARYKILVQFILFLIGFYYLGNSLYIAIFYAGASTFILNSFNITDGLDGLAAGIGIPVFSALLYLENNLYGMGTFFQILLLTLLFLIVFLLFNIKPAKAWLGDSGSYAIGAILAFSVFRYNVFLTIPLILIFLLEGLSSLLQILSIQFTQKKIFKIAPLHLHLLNSGWSQWQIILTGWILQIVLTLLVLITSGYVK